MVMLLLPASRASSTNASRKDQGIGSIVAAQDQVAVGIQSGGGALDAAVGPMHDDAPSCDVAGGACEQGQDGLFVLAHNRIHVPEQANKNFLARKPSALVD